MTGGGTGGTITPLLAVSEAIRLLDPTAEILFLLTKNPSESTLVRNAGFSAQRFPAGKWRRYFDLRNIRDLFVIGYAFFRSLFFLSRWRPNIVVSAGSFLSVPIAWAAKLMGIPALIHQQDLAAGLANRLMAKTAAMVTVTFAESKTQFGSHRTVHITGNPVRESVMHGDPERGRQIHHLEPNIPTLLVLGGSSGASFFSTLLEKTMNELAVFCQVVHVTGKRAPIGIAKHVRYHAVPFLSGELADTVAVADVVVTRAGLSTLSELAACEKPVCIIPMPDTHQEANAQAFASANAAVVFSQKTLKPDVFVSAIRNVLMSEEEREKLRAAIRAFAAPEAARRIATNILSLARP